MIKGLYSAASAMIANLTRQGILAHNVSNMDTPGFKEILVSMDDWSQVPVLYPPGSTSLGDMSLIGNLGLGVETSQEITDFNQGGLQQTNQPFDFSIQGSGFFRVQTPDGERYTRDGRFTRDVDGNLVTVDGYQVMDDTGQAINLPEGDLEVSPDGTLAVNSQNIAKLGLAAFEDPSTELKRDLPNLFIAEGGATSENTGTVQQGFLEMSNTNPSQLMTQMVAVARAYEAAQKMVQTQDELLGTAISRLGNF
jgi:flagellar basal-body rod protein FlgF